MSWTWVITTYDTMPFTLNITIKSIIFQYSSKSTRNHFTWNLSFHWALDPPTMHRIELCIISISIIKWPVWNRHRQVDHPLVTTRGPSPDCPYDHPRSLPPGSANNHNKGIVEWSALPWSPKAHPLSTFAITQEVTPAMPNISHKHASHASVP